MTTLDAVLAILAILALALFLGVLIFYVQQTALIVVCVLTVLMAAFDFVREFAVARRAGAERR